MSEDVQFNLRIPSELKQQIVDAAKQNSRSINAEAQLRLQRTFELDNLPEPTNPKNITDPDKLEAWAKSILNELLKLKDMPERVAKIEDEVAALEQDQFENDRRLNGLEGRY
ncbi:MULTISPECIES: Arc family DNA-binding protein [unclassified Acinetobacter]|uniref:Arc family DNA-binding protein n=1 Tax=unclassified Acinetobacter TaxID=196816 RepID=UPI0015D394E9|nr:MULTISPECIES: Arc family DNA-binding protein [unclassified Acinetobacter]